MNLGRATVGLLEAATGKLLGALEPPGWQPTNEACFSPDGRYLIVATYLNRILVWDLVRLREELASAGLDGALGPGWTLPPPKEIGS